MSLLYLCLVPCTNNASMFCFLIVWNRSYVLELPIASKLYPNIVMFSVLFTLLEYIIGTPSVVCVSCELKYLCSWDCCRVWGGRRESGSAIISGASGFTSPCIVVGF